MRTITGIAALAAALAATLAPTAAAAVRLPARDPAWWSPGASLRLVPSAAGNGPEHAQFDEALTGWTLTGPGRVDVRTGGPARHYAAIRDNTTLTSAAWTPPATAQIVTVWARGLHQTEALRVGALIGGRLTVLGTIHPGLSWRRYALPATPIRGKLVQLVLDPVMPFSGGIDIAFPGHTETPARGFVFDVGAATRMPGGPDGELLAAEPGVFQLRGGAFTVPRDAQTLSVWLKAKAGTTPQVAVQANGIELGQATATGAWKALRFDATPLRGRSVRLRVRSEDAQGLELALIGTVQRAPEVRITRTARDPKHRHTLKVVLQGPTGLAGAPVQLQVAKPGGFRLATVVRLDGTGKAVAHLTVPLHATALRTAYAGSEAYAAGLSAVRSVRRAPKPPPVPAV